MQIDISKDDSIFGPLKVLFVAALLLAVCTLFGWLFVVSWLGVPWNVGLPMSLLAGFAMLAWDTSLKRRLLSGALWAVGAVWVVVWFIHHYS